MKPWQLRHTQRFLHITLQGQGGEEGGVVDHLFSRFFHIKTGGNAFYLREMIRFAQQHEVIYLDPFFKRWMVDKERLGSQSLVSPELRMAIVAEFDRLYSPEMQMFLKVSSVLGRLFSLETIAAVYPVDITLAELRGMLECFLYLGVVEEEEDLRRPLYNATPRSHSAGHEQPDDNDNDDDDDDDDDSRSTTINGNLNGTTGRQSHLLVTSFVMPRGAPKYGMTNLLEKEVCYRLLPISQRRRLHASIATVLPCTRRRRNDHDVRILAELINHYNSCNAEAMALELVAEMGVTKLLQYEEKELRAIFRLPGNRPLPYYCHADATLSLRGLQKARLAFQKAAEDVALSGEQREHTIIGSDEHGGEQKQERKESHTGEGKTSMVSNSSMTRKTNAVTFATGSNRGGRDHRGGDDGGDGGDDDDDATDGSPASLEKRTLRPVVGRTRTMTSSHNNSDNKHSHDDKINRRKSSNKRTTKKGSDRAVDRYDGYYAHQHHHHPQTTLLDVPFRPPRHTTSSREAMVERQIVHALSRIGQGERKVQLYGCDRPQSRWLMKRADDVRERARREMERRRQRVPRYLEPLRAHPRRHHLHYRNNNNFNSSSSKNGTATVGHRLYPSAQNDQRQQGRHVREPKRFEGEGEGEGEGGDDEDRHLLRCCFQTPPPHHHHHGGYL